MILVKCLDKNIVVWETEGQQGEGLLRVTLLCSPGHAVASSFMNTYYHKVYYLPDLKPELLYFNKNCSFGT